MACPPLSWKETIASRECFHRPYLDSINKKETAGERTGFFFFFFFFFLFNIFSLIHISRKSVIQRVCDAKLKEIRLGVDGFLVFDLGLVGPLQELWEQNKGLVNGNPNWPVAADLLHVPRCGPATLASLEHNIAVTILFIDAWLQGFNAQFERQ